MTELVGSHPSIQIKRGKGKFLIFAQQNSLFNSTATADFSTECQERLLVSRSISSRFHNDSQNVLNLFAFFSDG